MNDETNNAAIPPGAQETDRPSSLSYILPKDDSNDLTLEIDFDVQAGTVQLTEYLAADDRREAAVAVAKWLILSSIMTYLLWGLPLITFIADALIVAVLLPYVWYFKYRHRVVIAGPDGISAGTNRPWFGSLSMGRDEITSFIVQRGTQDRGTEAMQEMIAVDQHGKHNHILARTSLEEIEWLAGALGEALELSSTSRANDSTAGQKPPISEVPTCDLATVPQSEAEAYTAISSLGLEDSPKTIMIMFDWDDDGFLFRAVPIRHRWSRWYKFAAFLWILLMSAATVGYLLMLSSPTAAFVLFFVMLPPSVLLGLTANSLRDTVVGIRIDDQDLYIGAFDEDDQNFNMKRCDVIDVVLVSGRHFILETKLEQSGVRWFANTRGHSLRIEANDTVPHEVRMPYDKQTCEFLAQMALKLARSGSPQY